MRTAPLVCFVLAAISALVAARNVATKGPEDPSLFVSYAVGAFFLPLVLLIAGLVLLGKKKP